MGGAQYPDGTVFLQKVEFAWMANSV